MEVERACPRRMARCPTASRTLGTWTQTKRSPWKLAGVAPSTGMPCSLRAGAVQEDDAQLARPRQLAAARRAASSRHAHRAQQSRHLRLAPSPRRRLRRSGGVEPDEARQRARRWLGWDAGPAGRPRDPLTMACARGSSGTGTRWRTRAVASSAASDGQHEPRSMASSRERRLPPRRRSFDGCRRRVAARGDAGRERHSCLIWAKARGELAMRRERLRARRACGESCEGADAERASRGAKRALQAAERGRLPWTSASNPLDAGYWRPRHDVQVGEAAQERVGPGFAVGGDVHVQHAEGAGAVARSELGERRRRGRSAGRAAAAVRPGRPRGRGSRGGRACRCRPRPSPSACRAIGVGSPAVRVVAAGCRRRSRGTRPRSASRRSRRCSARRMRPSGSGSGRGSLPSTSVSQVARLPDASRPVTKILRLSARKPASSWATRPGIADLAGLAGARGRQVQRAGVADVDRQHQAPVGREVERAPGPDPHRRRAVGLAQERGVLGPAALAALVEQHACRRSG